MRNATLLLALAVTAACSTGSQSGAPRPATVPAAVAAPPTPTRVEIFFRQRVGPFVLVDGHRYPDPANGVQLRFRGPDSTIADVFVYPGPDFGADCSLTCSRAVLKRETEDFLGSFDRMIRERMVDSIRLVASRPIERPAEAIWTLGHHIELRVVRGGRVMRSDYVLYYMPGVRAKIRATYAASDSLKRYVAAFAEQTVPTLATAPIPLPEPTRENILRSIEGEWDWSTSTHVCGPNRHTIKVAPDGQSFSLSYLADSDPDSTLTLYHIISVGPGIVTDAPHTVRARIEGETRLAPSGRPVVWDLVLSAQDAYGWHRTDWDEDGRTPAIVRCN
jgi:hypothetical protein